MTLLLDTHLLLWAYLGSPDLPNAAADLILDARNDVAFSVASLWEVAIKSSLGPPGFQVNVSEMRTNLLENGYAELDISGRHVLMLSILPPIHRDPFDRLLIAQATAEGATLLTSDKTIADYTGNIKRV